ncbi:hypothetical protein, partial [Escherichia coli]
EGWAILLRQKQKKLIMLSSETMIWQPEFTDKTLSRKIGAVQYIDLCNCLILIYSIQHQMKVNLWTKNSYRLWLTNWPKTSKPLKCSGQVILATVLQ